MKQPIVFIIFFITLSVGCQNSYAQCPTPRNLSYTFDEDSIYFRWEAGSNADLYTFGYYHYGKLKWFQSFDTKFSLPILPLQGSANVGWVVKTNCGNVSTEYGRSTFTVPSEYTCNKPTQLSYNYDSDSVYFTWKGSGNADNYTFGYYHYGTLKWFQADDTKISLPILPLQGSASVGWVVKTNCGNVTTEYGRSTFTVPSEYTCNKPTELSYYFDSDSIYFKWKGSGNADKYTFGYYRKGIVKTFLCDNTTYSVPLSLIDFDKDVGWIVKTHCNNVVTEYARSSFFVRSPLIFYSIKSGNWNDKSVWSNMPNNTSSNRYPGPLDTAIIIGQSILLQEDHHISDVFISSGAETSELIIDGGNLVVSGKISLEKGKCSLKVRNSGSLSVVEKMEQ